MLTLADTVLVPRFFMIVFLPTDAILDYQKHQWLADCAYCGQAYEYWLPSTHDSYRQQNIKALHSVSMQALTVCVCLARSYGRLIVSYLLVYLFCVGPLADFVADTAVAKRMTPCFLPGLRAMLFNPGDSDQYTKGGPPSPAITTQLNDGAMFNDVAVREGVQLES